MGSFSQEELSRWAHALLLKIHVITGWNLPDESLMLTLKDQFQKKLAESYATVNADEIEHAFRLNETGVKDWGKSINLVLFDEVMQPYMNRRYELSKLEEQQKTRPEQLPLPGMTEQEIVDTAWDVWNVTGRLDYISESTYEILSHHALIVLSNEQKHQLMSAAHSYLSELAANDPELFAHTDRKEVQKRYAKKIAVANLFREHKDRQTKIYLHEQCRQYTH